VRYCNGMVTHKTKLLQLTKEKDCNTVKLLLESLDYQVKGDTFEWYLAELYRGNGWLTNIQGGKQDLGADILLYHPKTSAKAAMVIQAKNHFKPLTFDQTKIRTKSGSTIWLSAISACCNQWICCRSK
jgi:hypothetical protein